MTFVPTRDDLDYLVEFWKNGLGLNEWQIATAIEDPNEDSDSHILMSLHRHSKYNDASLRVHPDLFEEDPDLLRDTVENRLWSPYFFEYKIVHELLHATFRDIAFWTDTIEGYLHRDVDQAFENGINLFEERMVDSLAKSLVFQFGSWWKSANREPVSE